MNELAATVESKDPGAQFQSPCTDVSEGGDGGGAPSFEATQQGTFRGGTDGGIWVGKKINGGDGTGVVTAAFHGERTLGGGRHDDVRVETLGGTVQHADAFQPGAGQDDGVEILPNAAHPGVNVAAQGLNVQVGTKRQELGDAPGRGGSHADPVRQGVQGVVVAGDECFAGIGTRGHHEMEAGVRVSGQVFEGVHGNVAVAVVQGFAQGLGEHTNTNTLDGRL